MPLRRPARGQPRRPRAVLVAGALAAFLFGTAAAAFAQEVRTLASKDAIFARKILMDSINNNMDEIETMTASASGINLTEAREHAETISVMLLAFPHLFPESTNQWKPNVARDPGTDTFAAPEVWANYADFN